MAIPLETLQTSDVARAIQLAVGPVFLLTGIGAILSVLTNRLGRVVDRARALEGRYPGAPAAEQPVLREELACLARRARLTNRGIALCTVSALLVAALITVLFAGAFLGLDVVPLAGSLFVAAMLSLCGALVVFLQEVRLAVRTLRIGVGEG